MFTIARHVVPGPASCPERALRRPQNPPVPIVNFGARRKRMNQKKTVDSVSLFDYRGVSDRLPDGIRIPLPATEFEPRNNEIALAEPELVSPDFRDLGPPGVTRD